jgi:hypothetical protein
MSSLGCTCHTSTSAVLCALVIHQSRISGEKSVPQCCTGSAAEQPPEPRSIPVPVVTVVEPSEPSRAWGLLRRACRVDRPPSPSLPRMMSIGSAGTHELAIALGPWPDSRPWDGIRQADMRAQLRVQAGESVWREDLRRAHSHAVDNPGARLKCAAWLAKGSQRLSAFPNAVSAHNSSRSPGLRSKRSP